MAKAGFVLHGARGKVGNLVARKGENKTILAEYQPVVRNPQTNAQMAQRIILSTVAQAIPLLYPVIDHSFEGFAVGSKCTREFRRLNMALLRQYAAVDFRDTPSAVDATVFMTTKGVKALIPNKYQISSGSLSAPKVKIVREESPSTHLIAELPDINIPATKNGTNYVFKRGDLLQALFGITGVGEQLTFVVIQRSGEGYKYAFQGDDSMPGWVIPYTSMRAGRLVVDPSVGMNDDITIEIDGTTVDSSEFISAILTSFSTSEKTDGTLITWLSGFLDSGDWEWTWNAETQSLRLNWERYPDVNSWTQNNDEIGYAYAAGIIRSKLADNGNWMYSNAFMTLARIAADGVANYGLDWNSAIQAWFEKNAVTDNSLFLKEGATANELGESFT